MACGIFLGRELNPCPPALAGGLLTTGHQESPGHFQWRCFWKSKSWPLANCVWQRLSGAGCSENRKWTCGSGLRLLPHPRSPPWEAGWRATTDGWVGRGSSSAFVVVYFHANCLARWGLLGCKKYIRICLPCKTAVEIRWENQSVDQQMVVGGWLWRVWDAPASKARPWASRRWLTGLFGECLAVNRRCCGSLGGALVQLTVWWALVMEASRIRQERPDPPGNSTPRSSFLPTTLNSPGFPLVSVPRLGLISVLRPYTASELTGVCVCKHVACTWILGYLLPLLTTTPVC